MYLNEDIPGSILVVKGGIKIAVFFKGRPNKEMEEKMILKNHVFSIKKMLSCILIVLLGIPFFAQDMDLQEPLKYKVLVNAMAVPLFAVDTNGNPVFDLKKEELQLYVNDEPVDILEFRRYEFSHEQKIKEEVEAGETGKISQPAQDRVLFIILDTMFNSLTGFRRSKEIAINLIKEGLPRDHFVILENNSIGGLKYIGGAESDKNELVKKIKKLCTPPEKWYDNLFSSSVVSHKVYYDALTDFRVETEQMDSIRDLLIKSERQRYKNQVMYFSRVLSQFKYALKTIDKPKIVFLISEGVASGAFKAAVKSSNGENSMIKSGEKTIVGKGLHRLLSKELNTVFNQNRLYSTFLFRYLLNVVKAINKGGSVLYTINPKRGDDIDEDEASGEMSLRYLASESGGKYFAGSKPKKIIERVKKTTAAYYEIFFTIIADMGNDMSVNVECKRKGVRVHSLIHSERNKPYVRMEPVQKKVFALNVATGGSWSRMVGRVMKAKYRKTGTGKKEDEKMYTITIPLPEVMQDQRVDMFSIRMDTKTQKTVIDFMSREVTDVIKLKIKRRKGKDQFFVIIEPSSPYCIYNRI